MKVMNKHIKILMYFRSYSTTYMVLRLSWTAAAFKPNVSAIESTALLGLPQTGIGFGFPLNVPIIGIVIFVAIWRHTLPKECLYNAGFIFSTRCMVGKIDVA